MAAAILWRCRECGKWSHAKRDPIRHKRWHHEADGMPPVGWFVWCGPFDQWAAHRMGATVYRAALPEAGEPVSKFEEEAALAPDDGFVF